jgi:hypothetical protein
MYYRQPTTQRGDNMKSGGNRGAAMLIAVLVLTLAASGLNVVPAFADYDPGAVYQIDRPTRYVGRQVQNDDQEPG